MYRRAAFSGWVAHLGTQLETAVVVLGREGEWGIDVLAAFIDSTGIEIAAFIAIDAFPRFGKGRHEAALNTGDCFACALARATGQPLLFKGDDFSRTDIMPAMPPTRNADHPREAS